MAKKSTANKNPSKMILPGAAGPTKTRFCLEHNEKVQPVKIYPRRTMRFQCSQGCSLKKEYTILR